VDGEARPAVEGPEPGPAAAERILIIEDDADVRGALAKILSAHFRTIEAEDGDQGLAAARRERPDLVISDLVMPGRSGYDVCRELRADEQTRRIPLVILTGRTEIDAKIEGFESGADDYIAKPFNARELVARVRALLHSRALERALERKNREFARVLAELKAVQEKAIEAERLKTAVRMAGALAHEINNPLAGILGLCDLIRTRLDAKNPLTADIQGVVEQAQRIADVVRRIGELREVRFVRYVGDEEVVDLGRLK